MTTSSRVPSRWPLGLVLLAAMVYPSLLAFLYFRVLAGGNGSVKSWQQMTFGVGKAVQFAFPILFVWIGTRRWPAVLQPSAKGVGLGIGFGLLVMGAMLGLYYGFLRHSDLLSAAPGKVRTILEEFQVRSAESYLVLAGLYVLLHSLMEEYFYRWFVFGQLRRLLPLTPAILLSSLAFMGHHVIVLGTYFPGRFFTAVLPFSLGVAVGGAFWAWLYQRSGTLLGPWLSHLLVDASIFIIGWDLWQRSLG